MHRYFNRELFQRLSGPFTDWPIILCPKCQRASLEPSITEVETAESLAYRDEEFWDPEFIRGVFHGQLTCSRTACQNSHVAIGTWEVTESRQLGEPETPYESQYYVVSIVPPLPLVNFPTKVPASINEPIEAASAILFADASAAANRIRTAIEVLLDEQRVRKLYPGSRTRKLETHKRIEAFSARNSRAADQLMAMKWIGNFGSHERKTLPLTWVLDGLEHFSRAVELIYDKSNEELDRRALSINKKGRKLRLH